MTTKRLAILCAVVLGTFSVVYLLPRQLGYQPVGVVMRLPEYLGAWWGKAAPVTQQEIEVLGTDTAFERKNYFDASGDHVFASIVLAGQDMMTGIHRPERCLLAQGWTTGSSSVIPVDVPGLGRLKVTRLQTSKANTAALPAKGPAQVSEIRSLSYYFFVGYTGLAASHEQRIAMDFRDRILHGYNQRWAMVMLTSEITKGLQPFGHDEAQTDELVVDFLKKLAPQIVGESVPHVGRLTAGR